MTAVNDDLRPGVVVLMDLAWRTIRWAIDEHVKPRVAGELGDLAPRLRTSHLRLLSLTPPEGMRLTDLAARATMSKQALGEFVATLQGVGLVEVATDARDRRVRVVRPTAAGRRVQRAIEEAFAEVERGWQAEVGARRWAAFREVLAEIGGFRHPRDDAGSPR